METVQRVFILNRETQTATAEVGAIGITAIIIRRKDRAVLATKIN